ncbi:MAG: fibronectin type III domain-containing protein [Verrucomicrobia bacterium]|nr:fibronectin type III domain-containing protein [Verrucomicrobiota bacterium]
MLNIIKNTVPFLVTQAGKAIGGMVLYVAQLSLPYAVAEDLDAKLADLLAADNAHKQSKVLLKARKTAVDTVVVSGRSFMTVARDVVKPTFGSKYNQLWDAMGLVGSISIPLTAGRLLPALQSAKGNFLAAPALENAPLGVTAVIAGTHYDALLAANNAHIQQKDAVNQALMVRLEKAKAMERALRVLLSELHMTLDPLDPRWLSFGFKKPGALATPDVPQNLTAVLIGTNAIAMKWDSAPRASHYRVWKKVIGVDADFVFVGNPADLDFTIEGLPGNSQVEVLVSAVNNGGESQKSTLVLVQTL